MKTLTHSLAPRSTALLEKLRVTQLVKKLPAFYGTQRFITVFKRACLIKHHAIKTPPPHKSNLSVHDRGGWATPNTESPVGVMYGGYM